MVCASAILGVKNNKNRLHIYKPPGWGGYDFHANRQFDGGSPGLDVGLLQVKNHIQQTKLEKMLGWGRGEGGGGVGEAG